MLIVLEGADGVGKTTLAEQIRDLCPGMDLRHFGPPERHPLDEWEGGLADYTPGTGQDVICDRLHLGELVYAPRYRGKSELGPVGLAHVNMFLRSRGAFLVIVTTTPDVARRRAFARGETYVDPEDFERIIKEYHQLTDPIVDSLGFLGLGHIDTTDPLEWRWRSLFNAQRVIVRARGLEQNVHRLTPFPHYIGGPRPDTLLLGERGNPPGVAPFMPFPKSCGRWLMEAILPYVSGLGIVNVREVATHALWDALGRPAVVALGRVAQRECEDLQIPHRAVRHPQWWRRFAHDQLGVFRREVFG